MSQDKDWIDAMRSSLRDAEPTPPKGGWERLERELGAVKPPVPAWRIYWPRIAAAAAVLLCIVAGEMLLRGDHGVMTDGNVIMVADGGGDADDPFISKTDDTSALAVQAGIPSGLQAVAQTSVLSNGTVNVRNAVVEPAPSVDFEADGLAGADRIGAENAARSENARTVPEPVSAADTKAKTPSSRTAPGNNLRQAYGEDLFAENTPRRNKTSVGLFAGGGMIGGKGNAVGGQIFANAMQPEDGDAIMNQKFSYSDYSYRHRLPLSFGLAVRKDFAHGLSLETGVNYTLLMSDVKVLYGTKDISQKLHFIGVPLRLNWRFFERSGFSLYVGAGGMVEKCVAARFGSRSVEEGKVQWSAFAIAGAQYRLGGVAAIYFEPEVSHYFTKTTLRTARTDSSVALTLRLGVRFSF